jgi:hypothetical protein
MSAENPHPIDQELRAWAARRRRESGPGWDLHPADRRLLQDEVRRLEAVTLTSRQAHPRGWRWWWPRTAVVGGVAAVLLLAVIQFTARTKQPHLELAQAGPEAGAAPQAAARPTAGGTAGSEALAAEVARVEDRADVAAVSPAPPAATGVASLTPVLTPQMREATRGVSPVAPVARAVEPSVGALTSRAEWPAEPPPSAAPDDSVRLGLAPPGGGVLDSSAVEPGLRTGPVAGGTPAAAWTSLAPDRAAALAADGFADAVSGTGWTQAFTQIAPARRNFNAPAPVALQSFHMVQRGAQLQVIDADGSVYEGAVLSGDPVDSSKAGVGLRFDVRGLNRTRQMPVHFRGTVVTGLAERVQGEATIGERDRVVVDAVPSR